MMHVCARSLDYVCARVRRYSERFSHGGDSGYVVWSSLLAFSKDSKRCLALSRWKFSPSDLLACECDLQARINVQVSWRKVNLRVASDRFLLTAAGTGMAVRGIGGAIGHGDT